MSVPFCRGYCAELLMSERVEYGCLNEQMKVGS